MGIKNDMRILGALLRKEVKLMRRNPIIPKMILIMPVMVMLLLPFVATMDVKNVNVVVVDNDRTQLSRRLMADIDAVKELTVTDVVGTHSEAVEAVEKGSADVILTVPYGWERDLSDLDVEANGMNATKGVLGTQYVTASIVTTLGQWRQDQGVVAQTPNVTVSDRYNPTLNFRNFMIPALMIILLIIICGFLPALNLVSEKESGTIEAMNVTPVGKFTFVLSKLIPFWVVGILVITVGMLIGWLVYGLRPDGSVGAIYLAAILFSLIMSGIGVTIANSSSTMLQSIFVMFAIIVIFQLMGGLFTPISSMPQWAQAVTYILPPRYFNEVIRAVYLKGATVSDLWLQYLSLAALAVAVCAAAALTYRKRS
jgi:hypothetical protein